LGRICRLVTQTMRETSDCSELCPGKLLPLAARSGYGFLLGGGG
jgi:hypothetical protein